jgi:Ser/Thr protein kinase RdoA (MazF antagonist)
VSPLAERKRGRRAYRVDTAGGAVVKVRHVESAAVAHELHVLRSRLDDSFAHVLGRYGATLVEEWVDGDPLTPPRERPRVAEAGSILGRLHTIAPGDDVPAACPTSPWSEAARIDLDTLAAARALDRSTAAALVTEIRRRDPGKARQVLLHRDFCAENLIVDRRGRLRVIDNEWLQPGPAGFDLGRTRHRWPMRDSDWSRFLAAYEAVAGGPPDLTYWTIAAAAFGARVICAWDRTRLPPLLGLLGRLAQGYDLDAARGPAR